MPVPRRFHLDIQKFSFNIFSPIAFRKPVCKERKKISNFRVCCGFIYPQIIVITLNLLFCSNPLNVIICAFYQFPPSAKGLVWFWFFVFVFKIGFLCSFGTCWNSLYRSCWPRTQRSTCLCLLSAGIKGVQHHSLALVLVFQDRVFLCSVTPSVQFARSCTECESGQGPGD
ncbi:hypothetical protein ACRRTK_006825 [Alexandromys fortis]